MPTETARLDIEALKKLHAKIDQERRNAQANLNAAQNSLDQLRSEAAKQYGTDDLAELRKKLDEMKAANELARARYQTHLEEITAKLADVEKNFPSAGAAKA